MQRLCVAIAVLLCIVAVSAERPGCAWRGDCRLCIASPSCGWCEAENRCLDGTVDQPSTNYFSRCAVNAQLWHFNECGKKGRIWTSRLINRADADSGAFAPEKRLELLLSQPSPLDYDLLKRNYVRPPPPPRRVSSANFTNVNTTNMTAAQVQALQAHAEAVRAQQAAQQGAKELAALQAQAKKLAEQDELAKAAAAKEREEEANRIKLAAAQAAQAAERQRLEAQKALEAAQAAQTAAASSTPKAS